MGKKILKVAPFPLGFVTLPEKDRTTAIGNVHKNLIKIALVVPEISLRTVRQTDIHTDTLITILRNRSSGRTNNTRRPTVTGSAYSADVGFLLCLVRRS